MGAAASTEPPQQSNQSCKERGPAGGSTTELPRPAHGQRLDIPVFHSSWACWSTCSAVAQAGQEETLQQQCWIPVGKEPSPCTCGTRMRSRKGASLTRQCLNRGWNILSHPLALPGAVLCSGWHHHCCPGGLPCQEGADRSAAEPSSLSPAAKTPESCTVHVLGQRSQQWDYPRAPSWGLLFLLPANPLCPCHFFLTLIILEKERDGREST